MENRIEKELLPNIPTSRLQSDLLAESQHMNNKVEKNGELTNSFNLNELEFVDVGRPVVNKKCEKCFKTKKI